MVSEKVLNFGNANLVIRLTPTGEICDIDVCDSAMSKDGVGWEHSLWVKEGVDAFEDTDEFESASVMHGQSFITGIIYKPTNQFIAIRYEEDSWDGDKTYKILANVGKKEILETRSFSETRIKTY